MLTGSLDHHTGVPYYGVKKRSAWISLITMQQMSQVNREDSLHVANWHVNMAISHSCKHSFFNKTPQKLAPHPPHAHRGSVTKEDQDRNINHLRPTDHRTANDVLYNWNISAHVWNCLKESWLTRPVSPPMPWTDLLSDWGTDLCIYCTFIWRICMVEKSSLHRWIQFSAQSYRW